VLWSKPRDNLPRSEVSPDFTFHDVHHAFGTWLADAGLDLLKVEELIEHASTMRYMQGTDQGKRGAITVLSEYRQQHCRKIVTNEKRQILQPAANRLI
jgi:integrase